jgi:hypothetical protein
MLILGRVRAAEDSDRSESWRGLSKRTLAPLRNGAFLTGVGIHRTEFGKMGKRSQKS